MQSSQSSLNWWSDVSPSLMTNKAIRNFLLSYSELQHPEVVKLVLIYGILSLQQSHGMQPLAVADIKKLLKEGFLQQTLGGKLETVRGNVIDIQNALSEFAIGIGSKQTYNRHSSELHSQAS